MPLKLVLVLSKNKDCNLKKNTQSEPEHVQKVTILILIYEYLLSKQVHGMLAKNSEKGLIWIVEMVTMGRFVFINIMVHVVWLPQTRSCDPLEAGHNLVLKLDNQVMWPIK